MNGFLIRVLISSVLLLGHSVAASENNAMSLIKQLPFAWAESPVAFTNVAHKACDVIREIENPTNRLECAKEYAESVFLLPKFIRKCDWNGFKARLVAIEMIVKPLPDDMPLSYEFKWELKVRWRLHAKEEFAHYASCGHRMPSMIYSGVIYDSEEQRRRVLNVQEMNKRNGRFDAQREMARKIRRWLTSSRRELFQRDLKNDCANLSIKRRNALMEMVSEATGEVPEWYQKELDQAWRLEQMKQLKSQEIGVTDADVIDL